MKYLFILLLFLFGCNPYKNPFYQTINERTPEEQASAIKYMRNENIPESHIKLIVNGQIQIGFSYNEVTWAWGYPDSENETKSQNYTWTQAVYRYRVPKTYLYFENNILTDIQTVSY